MHKFFKKKLIYLICILYLLSIWFSIDTNFDNIFQLFNNRYPWKHNINIKFYYLFLRSSGPFIIFFIILFLSFLSKDKIQILTKNKALNFTLIVLYINFIFQIIALLFSENNLNNSYYALISILSIVATANLYNYGLYKINYLISLCVLTPIVIAYGYLSYEWFFTTRNLNMYGTFPDVFLPLVNFSSNLIRSSGLSRSVTILLIPLFFLIIIDKIKFFYFIPYSKLLFLFPYLILISIIFYCQSRIILFFFISFSIFSIVYFLRNENIKYRFQKFFILLILPIIFVTSTIILKEEFHEKKFSNKVIKIFIDKETFFTPIDKQGDTDPELGLIRKLDPKSITSNRFSYWQQTIKQSKKPIIGYGPLGDRFLIQENSHNLLVYTYASGGIVSSILILILLARYTYLCLHLTFIKKIPFNKKNIYIFCSIFTISFLFIRGIVEISIAVFSIDFLVFLSCIGICEKFTKMKNNI